MGHDLLQALPAERPVLLLDIDGVINVFQCAEARELRIAPDLPALKLLPGIETWLAQLDQAYSLIWCSHPEALLPLARLPWGLHGHPALLPDAGEETLNDWKLRAARRIFGEWPGALAWVEDGFPAGARDWASARLQQGRRTWLVDVSEEGLTADMTAALVEWARA